MLLLGDPSTAKSQVSYCISPLDLHFSLVLMILLLEIVCGDEACSMVSFETKVEEFYLSHYSLCFLMSVPLPFIVSEVC